MSSVVLCNEMHAWPLEGAKKAGEGTDGGAEALEVELQAMDAGCLYPYHHNHSTWQAWFHVKIRPPAGPHEGYVTIICELGR